MIEELRPPVGIDDPRAAPPVTALRDVAVIGGGCYGTFYARQLAEARARGRLTCRRVMVVDRDPGCRAVRELRPGDTAAVVTADWGAFLDAFLSRPQPPAPAAADAVVPSPLMPHLMADWLLREATRRWPGRAARLAPVERAVGTPYDRLGPEGTRYVSFADWTCPTHCVEPHLCPVIAGPRTWEMGDALVEYTAHLARERPTLGPALFVTRHRAFGVGMFDVAEAVLALRLLEEAAGRAAGVRLVVATISSCHGAVSLLELGAPGAA
jgi:hypothetical protein